jgi:signal transduction histidine kinase
MGQLAAGIAHEIRNPLNTIYNALYDLTEIIKDPSPEVDEDISISMDEIKRVQDIINNLLDFARDRERSSGQSDLNDVIWKTIRLVNHDLTNKRISIECKLEDLPQVAITSNAIKQILINLITNASQAMKDGGALEIRTSIHDGPVPPVVGTSGKSVTRRDSGKAQVRLAPRGGDGAPATADEVHIRLEISDTGPGIPPEVMPDIFNPFYTTKPPGRGTGLGLSVVHSLISDAGGAISVTSQMGEGTTFTLELPTVSETTEDDDDEE